VYSVLEALRHQGTTLEGKSVAIQGFGNLGSHAATFFTEAGAKVVASVDVRGGVYNPQGIDVQAAFRQVAETGSIVGLASTDAIGNQELLQVKCDILVPAALQNQITEANAHLVQARFVAEGANGPITPAGEKILVDKGIFVLPDIVANAGGAVVAYFELVQDLQYYFWTEGEVFQRLEKIMKKTCNDVYEIAETNNVTMRTAAWMTALNKIILAMRLRGWVR
jgi:glutamate dehydrogenase/leucine dehydrogenase